MPTVAALIREVAALTAWLLILTLVLVPVERFFELAPRRRTPRLLAEDLGFYFFNSIVPAIFLSMPIAIMVRLTHHLLPVAYVGWLNGLPLAVQLLATFVVGEIGFYWGHRWSHESPLLWQFHALHHRPRLLDWLINTRAHPVDIVFGRLCGIAPIYLLGLAGRGAGNGNLPAVLFALAGVAWGFVIHANVRWRLNWIDRLIATPRFHHWHHTREGAINRNYASMLPLIDRLFGTFHMPDRQWPTSYGVREPSAGASQIDEQRETV